LFRAGILGAEHQLLVQVVAALAYRYLNVSREPVSDETADKVACSREGADGAVRAACVWLGERPGPGVVAIDRDVDRIPWLRETWCASGQDQRGAQCEMPWVLHFVLSPIALRCEGTAGGFMMAHPLEQWQVQRACWGDDASARGGGVRSRMPAHVVVLCRRAGLLVPGHPMEQEAMKHLMPKTKRYPSPAVINLVDPCTGLSGWDLMKCRKYDLPS